MTFSFLVIMIIFSLTLTGIELTIDVGTWQSTGFWRSSPATVGIPVSARDNTISRKEDGKNGYVCNDSQ